MGIHTEIDVTNIDGALPRMVPVIQSLSQEPGRIPRVKPAPRHASEIKNRDKDVVTSFLVVQHHARLAELIAPEAVADSSGSRKETSHPVARVRCEELAAGLGIVTRPKPTYWMWNRVIGDTIDLDLLRGQ